MADDKIATTGPVGIVPFEDFLTAERPAGADEGQLGNEWMGREDITMPRIGISQLQSPELNPTNSRYIEGLQFNQLFHTGLKKNLGAGPIYFVILRSLEPRWVEFNPIDQGGGVKDMNVPKGDPRTAFTTGADGKSRVKPVATQFNDYIVLTLNELNLEQPLANVVALSFKSTGLRAAKHLNYLIAARGQKLICRGVYKLGVGKPETDKKSGGTYSVYAIDNAGWLKEGSAIWQLTEAMYNDWKEKAAPKIDIDAAAEVDDSLAANPEDPSAPQM